MAATAGPSGSRKTIANVRREIQKDDLMIFTDKTIHGRPILDGIDNRGSIEGIDREDDGTIIIVVGPYIDDNYIGEWHIDYDNEKNKYTATMDGLDIGDLEVKFEPAPIIPENPNSEKYIRGYFNTTITMINRGLRDNIPPRWQQDIVQVDEDEGLNGGVGYWKIVLFDPVVENWINILEDTYKRDSDEIEFARRALNKISSLIGRTYRENIDNSDAFIQEYKAVKGEYTYLLQQTKPAGRR